MQRKKGSILLYQTLAFLMVRVTGLSHCASASAIQQKEHRYFGAMAFCKQNAVRFIPTYGLSHCTNAANVQRKGHIHFGVMANSKGICGAILRVCYPYQQKKGGVCPLLLVRVTGLGPARINTRS